MKIDYKSKELTPYASPSSEVYTKQQEGDWETLPRRLAAGLGLEGTILSGMCALAQETPAQTMMYGAIAAVCFVGGIYTHQKLKAISQGKEERVCLESKIE